MITTVERTLSKRISVLRDNILNAKPTVCSERAGIYTEVYRQNAAKPIIIKRAMALSETLKKMTVFIDPNELIVGNHSSKLRAAPIFPEYAVSWILGEIDELDKRTGDKFYVSQQDRKNIKKMCAFWQGQTLLEKGLESMPESLRQIHQEGIIRAEGNLTSGDGHLAVNFERVL